MDDNRRVPFLEQERDRMASRIWKAASSPRTSGFQNTTEVFTTQGVNSIHRGGYLGTHESAHTLPVVDNQVVIRREWNRGLTLEVQWRFR